TVPRAPIDRRSSGVGGGLSERPPRAGGPRRSRRDHHGLRTAAHHHLRSAVLSLRPRLLGPPRLHLARGAALGGVRAAHGAAGERALAAPTAFSPPDPVVLAVVGGAAPEGAVLVV